MERLDRGLGAGLVAHVRCTQRVDGDLAVDGPAEALAEHRRAVADGPWLWLRQVHGAEVVVAGAPSDVPALAGSEADAAVTGAPGVVLAVHTADCAPVVLLDDAGALGVVHAGWRGLAAGVVQAAATRLRQVGGGRASAVLGPCIGPECYEFSPADLAAVAQVLGDGVRGRTSSGRPALDVPAAVDAALADVGIGPAERLGPCTSCAADRHFSHRARGERQRQATVAWFDDGAAR